MKEAANKVVYLKHEVWLNRKYHRGNPHRIQQVSGGGKGADLWFRAKGSNGLGSDIDLAVVAPQFTQADIWRISADLDDLEMLYSFDLLLYDKLQDVGLKDHIDRVGQELYRTEMEQRK